MGNQNPEADAEAAHGPDPSKQREPSRATPNRIADGAANGTADGIANGAASQAPANGNTAGSSSSSDSSADEMENGQAGSHAKGSKAAKS